MPLTYNEIVASTLFRTREEAADNIMSSVALVNELVDKGKVEKVDGGYELREPAEFALPAVQYFSGYAQLNNASYEGLTDFVFPWRQCQAPVTIDGMTMRKNKGSKTQIINLMDTKVKAARKALKIELQTSLKSDGSRLGGTEFIGLGSAVATTPTNIYGGIARSDYAWAKNATISFASDLAKPASAATIQDAYLKAWIKVTVGNDSPKLFLAGNTHWSYFHNSLTAIQRLTEDTSSLAKAGFRSLQFMDAKVVLDNATDDAATPLTYIINTDYLRFIVHSDLFFAPLGGKREPVDQDAVVQYLSLMGQLTCNNPRMQCVVGA